jgi:hypothetical protein
MPASEVARKREHDLEDWKQRGIGGVVRELNPQTAEITLELRGPAPPASSWTPRKPLCAATSPAR